MKNQNTIREKENIMYLVNCIVNAISPLKIYLFGSFAKNKSNANSDYDFYVIVEDREENILDLTQKAYKSIRGKKNRPVDIVVSNESKYEERKNRILSLEREISESSVLLYTKEKGAYL